MSQNAATEEALGTLHTKIAERLTEEVQKEDLSLCIWCNEHNVYNRTQKYL